MSVMRSMNGWSMMAHTLEQVIQPHLSPTVKRENWDGFGYDCMGTDYYGEMKGMKHLHRLIQNECDGCTCSFPTCCSVGKWPLALIHC